MRAPGPERVGRKQMNLEVILVPEVCAIKMGLCLHWATRALCYMPLLHVGLYLLSR